MDVYGFGAVGYFNTGDAGTEPLGAFEVHEASLFLVAHAAENISVFFEIQTNRLGEDGSKFVRTGEVHAHIRDLWRNDAGDSMGLKVGRIDIPFGEEYLWQDAPDNPLISQSAAFAYGFDEGVLLYGKFAEVGWIAAVTDGTDARSREDHVSKAINLKVHGRPLRDLYLSASYMNTGSSGESAIEFGGGHLEPVGSGGQPSALGASPSNRVDANLYELDARWTLGPLGELSAAVGHATIHDRIDTFSRDLTWFHVQDKFQLGADVFAAIRYSEIGTYDGGQGFHFDGETIADGNAAFGYDSRRLQRLSVGLGWQPKHNLLAKLEVGRDWFEVIDASPLDAGGDDRVFFGGQLVISF